MKNIYENDNLAELRSEFAANVSHELKTPLTSIKGFADMLASGVVTDEDSKLRFLTMISVEADRMITLINDILLLSELEEEYVPKNEANTEVLPVIEDTIESLKPSADAYNIVITASGDQCCLPIEENRVHMLMANLIENAIKYNVPNGYINISVKQKDGKVKISISDSGIGIPYEHQARVFERFYRVDKSRSKKTGGSGLGLAIVKHITALYNGRLTLESEPEVGTTITVEFAEAKAK